MNIQATQINQSKPGFKSLCVSAELKDGSKIRRAIVQAYKDRTEPAAKKTAEILAKTNVSVLVHGRDEVVVKMQDSSVAHAIRPSGYKNVKELAASIRESIFEMAKDSGLIK